MKKSNHRSSLWGSDFNCLSFHFLYIICSAANSSTSVEKSFSQRDCGVSQWSMVNFRCTAQFFFSGEIQHYVWRKGLGWLLTKYAVLIHSYWKLFAWGYCCQWWFCSVCVCGSSLFVFYQPRNVLFVDICSFGEDSWPMYAENQEIANSSLAVFCRCNNTNRKEFHKNFESSQTLKHKQRIFLKPIYFSCSCCARNKKYC